MSTEGLDQSTFGKTPHISKYTVLALTSPSWEELPATLEQFKPDGMSIDLAECAKVAKGAAETNLFELYIGGERVFRLPMTV